MSDPFGPITLSIAFLFFAALVCGLNTALPHADESDLRKRAEHGSSHSQRVLRLLYRFDRGHGEITMTYTLLLIASYASMNAVLQDIVSGWLNGFPSLVSSLLILIIFSIVAFTTATILPRGLTNHAPKTALRINAPLAECAIILLSPITTLAYNLGRLVLKPFHIQPGKVIEHVTEEEIRMMVDIGEEKGAIESDEKEMIENIFEFNNMTAEDCMIHRKDITAIDIRSTDEEVLQTIVESGLSRFPVYEGNIDNVIGVLTSRDFLLNQCAASPKPYRELIRSAHLVPESVRTDVLFREMQTSKQHMSIVVDEYGGTSGLITLEDLLEEIVGNIYDEFDPKEEQDITPLPDGRFRVSGSTELENLAETIDVDLPIDDEYDTLGGLVFSRMTEIPADGERPVVECFGLRISVTEIVDRRVEWALIEKLSTQPLEQV